MFSPLKLTHLPFLPLPHTLTILIVKFYTLTVNASCLEIKPEWKRRARGRNWRNSPPLFLVTTPAMQFLQAHPHG